MKNQEGGFSRRDLEVAGSGMAERASPRHQLEFDREELTAATRSKAE
jgi:hypothetical protein